VWAAQRAPVGGAELAATELVLRESGSGTREVLAAALSAWGGADGWTKLLKAATDVPVIDIAAAGVGTYFGAQQDINQFHRPAAVAYPLEAASNLTGLAAGAGTAGAVAGLTAAGAPVLGVAAGVAAGGVVAIGVGDFGHNLIDENWSGDIHQHGVVMGVVDGVGNSAVKTGKDMAHMATSVWHGITSLF
jgi:hypothetical protein